MPGLRARPASIRCHTYSSKDGLVALAIDSCNGHCGIFYSSTSSDPRRNHSSGPRSSTSQLFHDAGLHVRLGQYKQAIQDYDEGITLNPLHVNSYVARGRAHQFLVTPRKPSGTSRRLRNLDILPRLYWAKIAISLFIVVVQVQEVHRGSYSSLALSFALKAARL